LELVLPRKYILAFLFVFGLLAQSESGELRLFVKDTAGAGVAAGVELVNESTKTRQTIDLPAAGRYSFKNLPFGFYRLLIKTPGFVPSSELIEIRSAVPLVHEVALSIEAIKTSVEVTESDTLIDPNRTDAAHYVGSEEIKSRPAGLVGRGLLDLVVMQPGWTLEANGILHPRESEYDTQFVVNGFPVYDNRSPAFAPTVDADNVESMKVYTSGIPAEFGQKLGGVIEVNTQRNTAPGFHGTAVVQGGSFNTVGGFISGQYVAGRNTATVSAEGFLTEHYLDPPVTQNFTNHASNTSFTGALERDFTDTDRVGITLSHRRTWFLVPNDLRQQVAGQREDRTAGDSEAQIHYQHVFSASLIGSFGGMVRDVFARQWSNPLSTPIDVQQDRGYREAYIRTSLAGHHNRHEWKTGLELRRASVREEFRYRIVSYRLDPGNVQIFDGDLPAAYEFKGRSPDREQAFYAQDMIRLNNFTLSLGLRFDRYALLVHESGWSPRAALAWHSRALGLVLHASYDRTFGTPPFENLLVSAAPSTASLNGGFYLPIRPSRGNYYEAGFTQSLGKRARFDASYFRRDIRDSKDDDLLLNTGISFPIAFRNAIIRGVEVKLEVPHWGPFSGYLSYANTIGIGQFPISGGLFLDPGAPALLQSNDRFPISQDIRNTARAWLRYQISKRVWTTWSGSYTSGLPVEGDLPPLDFLEAQYGADVVSKVNFSRGRVGPSFSLNASIGADVWRHDRRAVSVQADVLNVTDRLNVINFAGLLSGTAISPPRSFGIRLRTDF
jgi:TonB dependent receptor